MGERKEGEFVAFCIHTVAPRKRADLQQGRRYTGGAGMGESIFLLGGGGG